MLLLDLFIYLSTWPVCEIVNFGHWTEISSTLTQVHLGNSSSEYLFHCTEFLSLSAELNHLTYRVIIKLDS